MMKKSLKQPKQAWIAKLTALDSKFGFNRKFQAFNRNKSAKTVTLDYELDDGFYEYTDPVNNAHGFFEINKGQEVPMERDAIKAWFEAKESENGQPEKLEIPASAVAAPAEDDVPF